MKCLLAVDIGTTSTKTLLIDEDGRILASASQEYELSTPHPGWVEADPKKWWNAVKTTVPQVLRKASIQPTAIKAIGLSGQMHGAVLTDEKGNVIRPCIIWADSRTSSQCEWITERAGGMSRLLELVSNPALVGFTAGKILWVRENEPENFARIHKVLLPKDFIRFKLTGEYVTDAAEASGTLLFDVKNRRWSRDLITLLELDENLLPQVVNSDEASGYVSAQAARETGLAQGTLVVGGGGDAVIASIGTGLVREGEAVSVIGAGGNFTAFASRHSYDPQGRIHTFCHPMRDKWLFMGVQQAAGLVLRWLRDNLGLMKTERLQDTASDSYEALTREAGKVSAGAEGLIFLPYLNGERTPHLDPDAKGVIFGATMKHTRAHLIRAAMEGVVYALRDSLEIMKSLGIEIKKVIASGGGAQSTLWRQMQADILGLEVLTNNSTEGSAYGAALAAAVGAGFFKDFEEAVEQTIRVESIIEPRSELKTVYDDYYGLYASLYAPLKQAFKETSRLNLL